jgi:peptidoglycan/LPS O-acetylase OafA/YrhL
MSLNSTASTNFDSMRILAAFGVLFSHAFPITTGTDTLEPLYLLTHYETIGTVCVFVFFSISGFLITRSFIIGGSGPRAAVKFVRARALRILPGLFVALLFLILLVGPFMTSLTLADYFRHKQTWSFLAVNLSLVTFQDGLPGVFTHNPFPDSVNGSLWTLRWEARCYALIFGLGVVRLLNVWSILVTFLASVFAFLWFGELSAALIVSFSVGSLLYFCTALVDARAALPIAIVAFCCSVLFNSGGLAVTLLSSYLAIWICASGLVSLPHFAKRGDFSYGVYIYAFPIQQMVTSMMGAMATWYWNVLFSAPITLVLAVVSWFLVERPALKLKGWQRRAFEETEGQVFGVSIPRKSPAQPPAPATSQRM